MTTEEGSGRCDTAGFEDEGAVNQELQMTSRSRKRE